MTHLKAMAVLSATLIAASTGAWAHAFLDHAVPGVGATVSGSPNDLQLTFTEGVVPVLSGVKISSVGGGGSVAASKPVAEGAATLSVHLGHSLKPGVYVVTWHVVSVDTHPTSGSYKFTVAP